MATVCFQMLAFNAEPFIEPALEAIKPYGHIVGVEGPVRYWQGKGHAHSADRTLDIMHRHCAAVVSGQWAEKDDMQRAAEPHIPPETTHVWLVDSDEVWPDNVLQEVIERLDDWDSLAFRFNSFWCGFDYIMGGFEERFPVHRIQRWHPGAQWLTHRPPTVLAPDGRPYRDHRHMTEAQSDARGWRCNHYSYCMPWQTAMKAAYYADRGPGMVIPDWFERVYMPWALGNATERAEIEREYQGVHNWLPAVRAAHGDATSHTRRYYGAHPAPIARRLPDFRRMFDYELKYDHREVRCEEMADYDSTYKPFGATRTCCVCEQHDCDKARVERAMHPARAQKDAP